MGLRRELTPDPCTALLHPCKELTSSGGEAVACKTRFRRAQNLGRQRARPKANHSTTSHHLTWAANYDQASVINRPFRTLFDHTTSRSQNHRRDHPILSGLAVPGGLRHSFSLSNIVDIVPKCCSTLEKPLAIRSQTEALLSTHSLVRALLLLCHGIVARIPSTSFRIVAAETALLQTGTPTTRNPLTWRPCKQTEASPPTRIV